MGRRTAYPSLPSCTQPGPSLSSGWGGDGFQLSFQGSVCSFVNSWELGFGGTGWVPLHCSPTAGIGVWFVSSQTHTEI